MQAFLRTTKKVRIDALCVVPKADKKFIWVGLPGAIFPLVIMIMNTNSCRILEIIVGDRTFTIPNAILMWHKVTKAIGENA